MVIVSSLVVICEFEFIIKLSRLLSQGDTNPNFLLQEQNDLNALASFKEAFEEVQSL